MSAVETTSQVETGRGPVLVRRVAESDLAQYRDLRLEALRLAPAAFGEGYEEALARPGPEWLERLRRGVGDATSATFVAAGPPGLVGMTGVHRERGAKVRHGGTVWGVYVRPSWRGLGLSRAMLEAALAWARGNGLRRLELKAVTENEAALRLYKSAGFEVVGTLHRVLHASGRDHDEHVMELLL